MPLYEYRCRKCNKIFTDIVPMNESNSERQCRYCLDTGDRILSATPIVSRLNVRISQKKQRRRIM